MKTFEQMAAIDVSMHVEKKGRFSYLSWPYAVAEFRKACPRGRWDVRKSGDVPFVKTETGCFVEVTVTPDVSEPDLFFSQIHPILDHQNKPIINPNSFEVNTSTQRCLVKAIALATGIGLYIYAGEDLPPSEDGKQTDSRELFTEYENACEDAYNNFGIEGLAEWWRNNSGKAKKELDKNLFSELTQLKEVLKQKG